MCTVCGCGTTQVRTRSATVRPKAGLTVAWRQLVRKDEDRGAIHAHRPDRHDPSMLDPRAAGETADYGRGAALAHDPGLSQGQMIRIEQDILGKNNHLAELNRRWLAERGIFALNLVSSPGSGKTTLLCRTITALAGRLAVAVIEGDQQTDLDAERIRATGARAVQINTGKGCHLDARMVGQALSRLELGEGALLLIENVGNLVCPAAFDLGEAHKVVILSVTEGEDKPLKYPDMFAAAELMLINKVDLLPYVDFDVGKAVEFAHRVNPRLSVIQVSATSGAGVEDWLAWIAEGVALASSGGRASTRAE